MGRDVLYFLSIKQYMIRNLFAAMYGANFKRSDPEMGTLPELTPEMFEYLKSLVQKRGRGLRDPYDPRNLFHSIYGGVFRRWSPSTRSQETQLSHIDQLMQNWTRQQLKIRKSESTRLELLELESTNFELFEP